MGSAFIIGLIIGACLGLFVNVKFILMVGVIGIVLTAIFDLKGKKDLP